MIGTLVRSISTWFQKKKSYAGAKGFAPDLGIQLFCRLRYNDATFGCPLTSMQVLVDHGHESVGRGDREREGS